MYHTHVNFLKRVFSHSKRYLNYDDTDFLQISTLFTLLFEGLKVAIGRALVYKFQILPQVAQITAQPKLKRRDILHKPIKEQRPLLDKIEVLVLGSKR